MIKRLFDLCMSALGLTCFSWLIILLWLLATIDTKSNGFFFQKRIGQFGRTFSIYKLKTINDSTRTISFFGRFLRQSKFDELPQLFNILIGQMSFVGARPDIMGYYDMLQGEDRKILELKPGLTSKASIKFANEEKLLNLQEHPLLYNDKVIFPEKIKMNLDYYYTRTFFSDIKIIWKTVFR